jgi:hypothetical protein
MLAVAIIATVYTSLWEYTVNALIALLLARIVLAWLADHRFRVPRFHLRANLSRATAAFFTTPEIK